jgi:hypothetical protein
MNLRRRRTGISRLRPRKPGLACGVEDRERLVGDGVVKLLRLDRLGRIVAARAEFEPVPTAPAAMRVARHKPSPVMEDVANADLVERQVLPRPLGEAIGAGPPYLDHEAAAGAVELHHQVVDAIR